MKVSDVAALLKCSLVCGEQNLDEQLLSACGSDLMSDVLAFAKHSCVLLTGMVNQHVVRTAEMLDVMCIVFVRGKQPSEEVCELAKKNGITLMSCKHTLYEACGLLFKEGLPPCSKV